MSDRQMLTGSKRSKGDKGKLDNTSRRTWNKDEYKQKAAQRDKQARCSRTQAGLQTAASLRTAALLPPVS